MDASEPIAPRSGPARSLDRSQQHQRVWVHDRDNAEANERIAWRGTRHGGVFPASDRCARAAAHGTSGAGPLAVTPASGVWGDAGALLLQRRTPDWQWLWIAPRGAWALSLHCMPAETKVCLLLAVHVPRHACSSCPWLTTTNRTRRASQSSAPAELAARSCVVSLGEQGRATASC